jgi:hypothetical protein
MQLRHPAYFYFLVKLPRQHDGDIAHVGSSELVNLSELCIAPGKAAWMAYLVCSCASCQSINFIVIEWWRTLMMLDSHNVSCCAWMQDVYCLDADGSLLDTALLASVAALAHCKSGCFVLLTDVVCVASFLWCHAVCSGDQLCQSINDWWVSAAKPCEYEGLSGLIRLAPWKHVKPPYPTMMSDTPELQCNCQLCQFLRRVGCILFLQLRVGMCPWKELKQVSRWRGIA